MKRLHVLVVEDDDTLRELLGEVLRGWGYQAVAVASGIRAVELLETSSSRSPSSTSTCRRWTAWSSSGT